jgi:imidazolonepropionase-like amidohydrolase
MCEECARPSLARLMPQRRPSMLAAPPMAEGRLWLHGGPVFDGRSVSDASAVLVTDGRIERLGSAGEPVPEGATAIDLAGRTLMPGLIDAHVHLKSPELSPMHGAEPIWPQTPAHFVSAALTRLLRMGFTTVRDVGSFGDEVVAARQAMRYRAFRGPRVLTCGQIISATAPGHRFFAGMYREADGVDDIRRAVREQLRKGADFIKVMSTGARSVELEDPDPAQLTAAEIEAMVDEAHRQGYRTAAHAEGLAGTELSIHAGIDTIEHGMYLNQRPDLLEAMAAAGQILVPTFSCFYGVAGPEANRGPEDRVARSETWSPLLVDLAEYNLQQAELTLRAAVTAGVTIAMGYDWSPLGTNALELVRMVRHGLTPLQGLTAATADAALALGLSDDVGAIEPGKLADLVVVDGDPLQHPELLMDAQQIWLVLQLGEPVAGAALERELAADVSVPTAAARR